MNERLSIREVSEKYHISARTLRFYEEAGILSSHRRENSMYREYDGRQIRQLEIILILRRLSFTVQEISDFLNDGGIQFNEILERRIKQSDLHLLKARETNQLLHKLADELSLKPASDISATEILSGFIYLTKQNERMLFMAQFEKSPHRIALGTDIAAGVTGENGGDLLGKIKTLRSKLEAEDTKKLPVIRIYDTKELEPSQATIFWDSKEIWSNDFTDKDFVYCSEEIIAQLRKIYVTN